MAKQYHIGELVYAVLGALPLVGTVVAFNEQSGQYLIRFSGTQQDWYGAAELRPYQS